MNRKIRGVGRAIRRVCWSRRCPGDDTGMALMLVVGSMLVLTLFAGAALTYAVNSLPLSRHDQDFNAALGAAQSGIDDYIRRLNSDDSYWVNPDCSNQALVGPKGQACDYSATVGWQPVNGDSNPNGPMFHYDIDSSTLSTSHFVTVTSTGKVNGVTRTLQASVGRGGSTDFVYYTDFEDADPANRVVYPTPPSNQACIDDYWWSGRSSNDSGCIEITFITGDVLNGPVHTNDTPLVTGSPEFVGSTSRKFSLETPDPACKTAKASNYYFGCWRGSSSQTPKFDRPPGPGDVLQLPDNSTELASDPGCQYAGQTRIRFTGDGYMLVWSPETTTSNSSTTADCGGASPNGVKVAVPDEKVIYARGNPDVAPHQCASGEIGDGLPLDGDISMQTADQYCGQGNIYIEGTLQGRVTVGAENSITVTGDLLLKNGAAGTDLLGLVAGNNVEVMHPWIATTTTTGTCAQLGWTQTAGQWISTSPGAVTQGAQSLGWEEGYFTGNSTSTVWHPGRWVTTTAGKFWQGPTKKPTSLTGSWVNAGKSGSPPQSGQVWQSGTWTGNSDGSFSWAKSAGWVNAPAGEYWQGENWTPHCAQYETTTSYGESSTWPHTTAGFGGIQIYASIQTLQHSFWVQNYNQGSKQGTLYVVGSIAQKYRGIVGQGSGWGMTGYVKSYNYDSRLVTQSPPYFPQWENAQWATVRFGELPPEYH